MKCDRAWLSEWLSEVPPNEALADLLTMAGLEVDEVEADVLTLDLTPNRSDCLSVLGLAREVATLTPATMVNAAPVGSLPKPTLEAPKLGTVESKACPYYSLRRVEQLDPKAATPHWMVARLEHCGIRSHTLLVDVTNYVMLELGQPLHAFDAEVAKGAVSVRWAKNGETLKTLNEDTVSLESDMLVIATKDQILGLAGIIGGMDSAVTEHTRSILLEAAHFTPHTIAGRARRLKLQTDSSHRFERGVDPALAQRALDRATELMVAAGGGVISEVAYKGELALPHYALAVPLRARRLADCLGIDIETEEVTRILKSLGCKVDTTGEQWQVWVPSWRFDLEIEEDLIEEVARVYGYGNIPPADTPNARRWSCPLRPQAKQRRHCQTRLTECGYMEAVTYSFVNLDLEQAFAPDGERLSLLNPISNEQAVMRSSLFPGLMQAARYNLNRQQDSVRLFELATVFTSEGGQIREAQALGGIAMGQAYPAQWGVESRAIDFFDVKGDIENLLEGRLDELAFTQAQHPGLHPGQTAEVSLSGQVIGVVGALHPELAARFDLPLPALVFELQLEPWQTFPVADCRSWPKYPQAPRDLAMVVATEISAGAVQACVGRLELPELRHMSVFDVYQGASLGKNRKSIGLRLIFQSLSGTLSDPEVEALLQQIRRVLKQELGAELRK